MYAGRHNGHRENKHAILQALGLTMIAELQGLALRRVAVARPYLSISPLLRSLVTLWWS